MKYILIPSLALLLVACNQKPTLRIPEPSPNWIEIARDSNSSLSYLDRSVEIKDTKYGTHVYFWSISNIITTNELKNPQKYSIKTKYIIYCKSKYIKETRTIKYDDFNGDGNVISDSGNSLSDALEIIPDTVGELFFNKFCPH